MELRAQSPGCAVQFLCWPCGIERINIADILDIPACFFSAPNYTNILPVCWGLNGKARRPLCEPDIAERFTPIHLYLIRTLQAQQSISTGRWMFFFFSLSLLGENSQINNNHPGFRARSTERGQLNVQHLYRPELHVHELPTCEDDNLFLDFNQTDRLLTPPHYHLGNQNLIGLSFNCRIFSHGVE